MCKSGVKMTLSNLAAIYKASRSTTPGWGVNGFSGGTAVTTSITNQGAFTSLVAPNGVINTGQKDASGRPIYMACIVEKTNLAGINFMASSIVSAQWGTWAPGQTGTVQSGIDFYSLAPFSFPDGGYGPPYDGTDEGEQTPGVADVLTVVTSNFNTKTGLINFGAGATAISGWLNWGNDPAYGYGKVLSIPYT